MKLRLTTFCFLFLSSVFFVTGCGEEDIKNSNIDCGEHGELIVGECKCDIGWEGERCDSLWSDKFTGLYTFVDFCNGSELQSDTSSITISQDGIDLVNFTNFFRLKRRYGYTETFSGSINGSSNIDIQDQTIKIANTSILLSDVSCVLVEAGLINISYTITDSSNQSLVCTSTWTLQ